MSYKLMLDLDDDQECLLTALAAMTGSSRASLMRRALYLLVHYEQVNLRHSQPEAYAKWLCKRPFLSLAGSVVNDTSEYWDEYKRFVAARENERFAAVAL